ncbi:aminopeptidase [Candidatus Parcubacteria bacterium]|nr:MAG: aminopeptidase [Candidatus Parcubacteria bacterium]
MKDPRVEKLARYLLTRAVKVRRGELVYIESKGDLSRELTLELVSIVSELGGMPVMFDFSGEFMRRMLLNMDEAQIRTFAAFHLGIMKQADAFISVRGDNHAFPLSDVPDDKRAMWQTHFWKPVHIEERVNNTRWCVVRYPNNSMADGAGMAQEPFSDFYFNACLTNYERMSKAMDPLVALMDRTDKVRIVGPGTDISFSIKGIPAIKCDGEKNVPDGEVYTAPVSGSMNGTITYNVPSMNDGELFTGVCYVVKNGKIVKATCAGGDEAHLNQLHDVDEGAREFGEFAIAVNPCITDPMKDILFDEKIRGSFHLTPGQAYENADNGNESKMHWDQVQIQTPAYGGGEIWFDGVLVRKDGIFVLPELEGLNPEALTAS